MEYIWEEKVMLSCDYEEEDRIHPTESDLSLIHTLLSITAEQQHHSLQAKYAALQREIEAYLDFMQEAGIRPWQDARFAEEHPTPEEFFYYKGEKLHRNFIEQLESPYHADRSGIWHSFHFYPNPAKISKKSGL